MKCIYCGYSESKVVDSRPLDDGTATRRRRECLKCGRRFTTYEKSGANARNGHQEGPAQRGL